MAEGTVVGTGWHEENLQEAVKAAWEIAKEHPAVKGKGRSTYECKISIDASNPIHAFIVTIVKP